MEAFRASCPERVQVPSLIEAALGLAVGHENVGQAIWLSLNLNCSCLVELPRKRCWIYRPGWSSFGLRCLIPVTALAKHNRGHWQTKCPGSHLHSGQPVRIYWTVGITGKCPSGLWLQVRLAGAESDRIAQSTSAARGMFFMGAPGPGGPPTKQRPVSFVDS